MQRTTELGLRLERCSSLIAEQGLDGWLVADFRWNNPLFGRLLGLSGGILTRRAFLWVPARGEPAVMTSRIDGYTVAGVNCRVELYAGFEDMVETLRRLTPAGGTIAMEYVEQGALPAVSRVDAGLVELIRSFGARVVSSGTLISALDTWTEEQQALHRRAARGVDGARRLALARCAALLRQGEPVTEGLLVDVIRRAFTDRGLEAHDGPDVAVGPNAADSHYGSGDGPGAVIQPDQILLIDLWARVRDEVDAPYADSTWMAFTGKMPPPAFHDAFDVVRAARDAGIDAIGDALNAGRRITGREVDRAARAVIARAGLGDRFTHRTGHSLGIEHVHGMGTNLDDVEFPDDRPLLPGSGVTVEPGLYWSGEFGVRLEVSAILGTNAVEVTTERQQEITRLS
jgi:Xaa-Pro aminopeptidase